MEKFSRRKSRTGLVARSLESLWLYYVTNGVSKLTDLAVWISEWVTVLPSHHLDLQDMFLKKL